MNKVSAQKIAAVLGAVPGMLRALKNERDSLLEKNASLESELNQIKYQRRVDELAKMATAKDINAWGNTYEEKIAAIERAISSGRDLAVLEEAVKLSSPQVRIGSLEGDNSIGGGRNSVSELELFVMGSME